MRKARAKREETIKVHKLRGCFQSQSL